MANKLEESVKLLISELEKRVDILNSGDTRANLNDKKYQELKNIISKYNNNPHSLKSTDVIKISKSDMTSILNILDLNPVVEKKTLKDFENNIAIIKHATSKREKDALKKYFDEIKSMILSYLNNYDELNYNQTEQKNKMISEYTSYIELFKQDNFEETFTTDQIEDLLKLMSSIGISTKDKQQILQYIAIKNINAKSFKYTDMDSEYPSLMSEVMRLSGSYLSEEGLEKDVIKDKLKNDVIDVKNIDKFSKKIANSNNFEMEKVKNIVVALVANNLLDRYSLSLENDDEELASTFKEELKSVIKEEVSLSSIVIEEAEKIIEENEEFYHNTLEFEDDPEKYIYMLISEMEDLGISHDVAIDLKTIPIIKLIITTLSNIKSLNKDDDDYELCSSLLKELVDAYNNLISKKEDVKNKM